MREYAKLGPTFWTGTTGKALRKCGPEALLVAAYLISAPGSNMLGLYYQPLLYMAHETGLGIEGASKGLTDAMACGFCSYDEGTEMVFVHEMAAWQIASELKPKDKRCAGIQRDYDALPDNPFLGPWFDRYAEAFHLVNRRGDGPAAPLVREPGPAPVPPPAEPVDVVPELPQKASPIEAPSKPHRSQEQEQEHRNTEVDTQRGVSVDNLPDPSPYGAAFGLLHRLGVIGASPGDPEFRAMVDKGVSDDEWRTAVDKAAGKQRRDLPYIVGIIRNQRLDAAAASQGLPARQAMGGVVTVPSAETTEQYLARTAAERAAAQARPKASPDAVAKAELVKRTIKARSLSKGLPA
jgi:hypothetical protein